VGECFFWYWLTPVVLERVERAVKRLCVFVCAVSCSTMECRSGDWLSQVKQENLPLFIKEEPDDVCCYINIICFHFLLCD